MAIELQNGDIIVGSQTNFLTAPANAILNSLKHLSNFNPSQEILSSDVLEQIKHLKHEILHSDKPVLLDFWAPWCGPCRMVGPVLEEIASSQTDIKVGKINVDEEPALAARFQIMSIPTLMVFKDGKITNRALGAMPKEQILSLL